MLGVPSSRRYPLEPHPDDYPRPAIGDGDQPDAAELRALSELYRTLLVSYDTLFARRIPNITLFYNAPCKPGLDVAPWHFHIQFLPPLRAADKLKYLAGFETGGGNIVNPSLPEQSAEELRRAGSAFSTGTVT